MKLDQVHRQLEELIGPSRALQVWQDCYDLAESVHKSPNLIVDFTNLLYRRCAKEIAKHNDIS